MCSTQGANEKFIIILVRKPELKRPLGKCSHTYQCNIEANLKNPAVEVMNHNHLSQCRGEWRIYLRVITGLLFCKRLEISWLANQLSYFEEGLCSVKVVFYFLLFFWVNFSWQGKWHYYNFLLMNIEEEYSIMKVLFRAGICSVLMRLSSLVQYLRLHFQR